MNDMVLGFLDSASPTMEVIIDLHHYIFFYLILFFVFVSWVFLSSFYYFLFILQNKPFTLGTFWSFKDSSLSSTLKAFIRDIETSFFLFLFYYVFLVSLFVLTLDLLRFNFLFFLLFPFVFFLLFFIRYLLTFTFEEFLIFLELSFLCFRAVTILDFELGSSVLAGFTIIPSKADTFSHISFFNKLPFTRCPIYTNPTLAFNGDIEYFPSNAADLFHDIYFHDRSQSLELDFIVLKNFNKAQQGATCSDLSTSIDKMNMILKNKIKLNDHIKDNFHHVNWKNNTYGATICSHDIPFYNNISLFQKNKEILFGFSTLLEYFPGEEDTILETFKPAYGKYDLEVMIRGKRWEIDVYSPEKTPVPSTITDKVVKNNHPNSMIIINNGSNISLKSTWPEIYNSNDKIQKFEGQILLASPNNLFFLSQVLNVDFDHETLQWTSNNNKTFFIPYQNKGSLTCEFSYFKSLLEKK